MDKACQFNSYHFRRASHQASYYWQCKLPHKAQTTHIGSITKGIEQFKLIIGQEWERSFIINHQPEITTFKVPTVTKMAIKQAGAFNEKFTEPVTRIMAASKKASSIVRKGKSIKNVIKPGSTRTPEIMAYDPWLIATAHSSKANDHVVYIINHTS